MNAQSQVNDNEMQGVEDTETTETTETAETAVHLDPLTDTAAALRIFCLLYTSPSPRD